MTIEEIEYLKLKEVKAMAIEQFDCKDYDCFIVDFKDRFGLSLLVFKGKKHIYYANDYELHHKYERESKKEDLISHYKKHIRTVLFTEDELMGPVTTYDDYQRKEHYVRSYLAQCYDNISVFAIGLTPEEEKKRNMRIKRWYTHYSSVGFAYFKDEEYIKLSEKIMKHLKDSYDQLQAEPEGFREMIRYELYNHECGYTGDYSEALSSLGIKEAKLTIEQQKILKEEFRECCEKTY